MNLTLKNKAELTWVVIKHLAWAILDILLIPLWLVAPPFVAIFTRAMPDEDRVYVWGGIFGTWDNPPQGDPKHLRDGLFPDATTGLKGYAMRVLWMWRNPAYGFAYAFKVDKTPHSVVEISGNPDITDKYAIAGSYLAVVKEKGKVVAYEYYTIKPYGAHSEVGKCFRMRWGWKIITDKWDEFGFAQPVDTITPYKGYGESLKRK